MQRKFLALGRGLCLYSGQNPFGPEFDDECIYPCPLGFAA